jgi:septal ring factor EnvC (AmiA/AmiB activator)
MITIEMLAADAALAGLTDEQKNAIALMSKNDEEVVIGNRFREVYNRLDDTIAKETGIARNGDEKTYNYLERAAKTLAAKANSVDGLNTKIADLTKERDNLKKQVAEGGDEATRKQLAQAQKDLDAIRGQYDELKANYDKAQTDHANELLGVQIDNVLAGAKAGLKFKPEFPQAATDTLLAQALTKVRGMNPELIDDGKGGKRLVFKGEGGEIARDP